MSVHREGKEVSLDLSKFWLLYEFALRSALSLSPML